VESSELKEKLEKLCGDARSGCQVSRACFSDLDAYCSGIFAQHREQEAQLAKEKEEKDEAEDESHFQGYVCLSCPYELIQTLRYLKGFRQAINILDAAEGGDPEAEEARDEIMSLGGTLINPRYDNPRSEK
jgi:hypothetical protein